MNQDNNLYDIAVIGMAVMGKNLALNIADKGYKVAVYNRTTWKSYKAQEENPEIHVSETLEDLVKHLKRPRKILIMVKSGAPVDKMINNLVPLLDEGDLLIDGGNSHFSDTQRRFEDLAEKNILFMGMGVSGGEEGARLGPALMPGGSKKAYSLVEDILDAIAAKAKDGVACQAYMGDGGAGHYVKMVHNGIEYADMEIIAELVSLLKANGNDNLEIADIFSEWNQGELSSYLSEITIDILREKDVDDPQEDYLYEDELDLDPEIKKAGAKVDSPYLLDQILDLSEQKGTGKWTNEEGLELYVDLSMLYSGLNARYISLEKDLRVKSSKVLPAGVAKEDELSNLNIDTDELAKAFLLARLIAYAQGFSLYRKASKTYGWNLDYKNIAATFRNGCIIRSYLLTPIMKAYEEDPDLENLLLADIFKDTIKEGIAPLRRLVNKANLAGVAVPAFNSALSYYDALRDERSQAALITAQRDYFGAHTYRRTTDEGIYHHEWTDIEDEA